MQEQSDDLGVQEEEGHCPPQVSLQMIDDLTYEDVKKCSRGTAVNKYDAQYHKLFRSIPLHDVLIKVCSCALLRDMLLQGRLYISRNWLCFHANLFGRDVKVEIAVLSVRLVKKHKTAGLVPNGLAITSDTGQKYVFVSLLSRDSVYDVLRRICTHLQVHGKKCLGVKQFLQDPTCLSMSVPVSLPDLLDSAPLLPDDTPYCQHTHTDRVLDSDQSLVPEPVSVLGQLEQQLKVFILLFRVVSLEKKLSLLHTHRCGESPCWLANHKPGT